MEELQRDQPEVETKITVTGQEDPEGEVCRLNFLAFDFTDRGKRTGTTNSCSLGTQCPEKKAFRARLTAPLFDYQAQWNHLLASA